MAIEYGMSSEEFWKCDPDLFASYRTSFINKQKTEATNNNTLCWLQGIYTQKALSVVYGNMWSKKTGKKYFSKPIDFDKKEETTKEEKSQIFEASLYQNGTFKKRYIENLKKERSDING